MTLSHAVLSLCQLVLISTASIDIGLRQADDEAIRDVAADMKKHGFDPSKQGDIVINIMSHHIPAFYPVPQASVTNKIRNIGFDLRKNFNILHLVDSDKVDFKEFNLVDGRHRILAILIAFDGEHDLMQSMLFVKIIVNVSPDRARILSYNASRPASCVVPCFLDEISCLFPADSAEQKRRADEMGLSANCLSVVVKLHDLLRCESYNIIARWRVLGLFSLDNIEKRAHVFFWKLLRVSDLKSLVRGRKNQMRTKVEQFNGLGLLDSIAFQVLIFAFLICCFKFGEENETCHSWSHQAILGKASSHLYNEIDSNLERVLAAQSDPKADIFYAVLRASAVSALKHTTAPDIREDAIETCLDGILRSSKWSFPEVPQETKALLKSLNSRPVNAPSHQTGDAAAIPVQPLIRTASANEGQQLSTETDKWVSRECFRSERRLVEVPFSHEPKVEAPQGERDHTDVAEISVERLESRGTQVADGPVTTGPQVEDAPQPEREDAIDEMAEKDSIPAAKASPTIHREVEAVPQAHSEDRMDQCTKTECLPASRASLAFDAEADPQAKCTETDGLPAAETSPTLDRQVETPQAQRLKLRLRVKAPAQAQREEDMEQCAILECRTAGPAVPVELPVETESPSESGHISADGNTECLERRRASPEVRKSARIVLKTRVTSDIDEGSKGTARCGVRRKREHHENKSRIKKLKPIDTRLEGKALCSFNSYQKAEELLLKLNLWKVANTGKNLFPEVTALPPPECKNSGWVFAVETFAECFRRPLRVGFHQLVTKGYNFQALIVANSSYQAELPKQIRGIPLTLQKQVLIMPRRWIPLDSPTHCIYHIAIYTATKMEGSDLECYRVPSDSNNDNMITWGLQTSLSYLPSVSGVVDMTGDSVDLLRAFFLDEGESSDRGYIKAVDMRFRNGSFSGAEIYNALRSKILETCHCGGHSLLEGKNEDDFNSHPQKDALDKSVSVPFSMQIQSEDVFFDYKPKIHYSVFLNKNYDTEEWPCDRKFFEDGQPIEQGAFISLEDYSRVMKDRRKLIKVVVGKSVLVDAESGMRDFEDRLSPFELHKLFVAGITDKVFWFFFLDESMASKFNMHPHPSGNAVSYEIQFDEKYFEKLYNCGWGFIRDSHFIIPSIETDKLKNIPKEHFVQCQKCKAVELFVDYGTGYFDC